MENKILFYSMTGHSKKIANAIMQKLNIPVFNAKEKPDIGSCDTLFIVTGVYGGTITPDFSEYLETLSSEQIKKVVLIISSINCTVPAALTEKLTAKGIAISDDVYTCTGGFLFFAMSHPNKQEIAQAVAFAERQINA